MPDAFYIFYNLFYRQSDQTQLCMKNEYKIAKLDSLYIWNIYIPTV